MRIGKLTLSKFIRGLIGTRLIDSIEVYYIPETNTFYPIISKSGCSTVKVDIIRRYKPDFTSKFPEIHQVDPALETNNKVLRKRFYSFKKYRKFSRDKVAHLVIRNPYERIYSCFLDVVTNKNVMYEDPSGLTNFFGIKSEISFDEFLKKVVKLPDYLSDRHFRSQSFYLQKGVEEVLGRIEVTLLENYNKKTGEKASKLNTNNKKIPQEILQKLKKSNAFKKRFSKDINMYQDIKNG